MKRRPVGGFTIAVLAASLVLACGGSTSSGGSGGNAGAGAQAGSGGSGAVSGSGGSGAVSGSGGSGAVSGSGGSGGTDWTACNQPGSCQLFANNCCGGYCDMDHPISGWTGVNVKYYADYHNAFCQGDIACPGCLSYDNPNYLAVCRQNHCVALDLRQDSLSECSAPSDCKLRWGSTCCESCSPQNDLELIAVSTKTSLEGEVCPLNGGACPPCAPPDYPSTAMADCVSGHCQVLWAALPGN